MTGLLTHPAVFITVAVLTGLCLLIGLLATVAMVVAAFDDGRR